MRHILVVFFVFAVVIGTAQTVVQADFILNVSSASYVGFIDKSTPANSTSEAAHINNLTAVAMGTVDNTSGPEYNRENSSLVTVFPSAGAAGAFRDDVIPDPNNVIPGGGYEYVLGKYGTQGHVWYMAGGFNGMDIVIPLSIEASAGGGGISHISGFNPVPEPTLGLLLGISLVGFVGVGAVRKIKQKEVVTG